MPTTFDRYYKETTNLTGIRTQPTSTPPKRVGWVRIPIGSHGWLWKRYLRLVQPRVRR